MQVIFEELTEVDAEDLGVFDTTASLVCELLFN